jgi:hypothetical protein
VVERLGQPLLDRVDEAGERAGRRATGAEHLLGGRLQPHDRVDRPAGGPLQRGHVEDLLPEAGVDQQGGRAGPVQQPPQVPVGVGGGQLVAAGRHPALQAPARAAAAGPEQRRQGGQEVAVAEQAGHVLGQAGRPPGLGEAGPPRRPGSAADPMPARDQAVAVVVDERPAGQRAGQPPDPAAGSTPPRRAAASVRRPIRYSSAPTAMEASAMPPTHQNQVP